MECWRKHGADVLVLGAGIVGLSAAMLLAKDGHKVTVLERDPDPPPKEPDGLWRDWHRRGVTQFHQGHFFPSPMRHELERELSDVMTRAEGLGALRFNPVTASAPCTGTERLDSDGQYDVITARRPVMEAAFANTTAVFDCIAVHRSTSRYNAA